MNLTIEQIKALPPEIRRLIVKYKNTNRVVRKQTLDGGDTLELLEQTFELQFIDKLKAIDMINRHIGFYSQDNQQKQDIIVVRPQKPS